MSAHTNYFPEPFVLQMGKNEAQKAEHGKKVYGKRQSDKEPRYSGPVLALRGRISQSKTELWDTMNTFMNDNNHFKYGESHSAQSVEGGESMQGWTSFIQNTKPSCFSDQGDRGGTGQMPTQDSEKPQSREGPWTKATYAHFPQLLALIGLFKGN